MSIQIETENTHVHIFGNAKYKMQIHTHIWSLRRPCPLRRSHCQSVYPQTYTLHDDDDDDDGGPPLVVVLMMIMVKVSLSQICTPPWYIPVLFPDQNITNLQAVGLCLLRRSQCRSVYRHSHAFSNTLPLNTSHHHGMLHHHTHYKCPTVVAFHRNHLTAVLQEFPPTPVKGIVHNFFIFGQISYFG